MIRSSEIQKIANKDRVRDKQIEKDYIISWILFGISQNSILLDNLIFKGGTALKKMYFSDYRYSEDIDFTLLIDNLSNKEIFTEFDKIIRNIKDESNITLKIVNEYEHKKSKSINFYIAYVGPLQGKLTSRDLKVDITRGEILEFDFVQKKVITSYTDLIDYEININCYSLYEVLIEKMTALIGRSIPRDLYDLWYLLEYEKLNIDEFYFEFERKALNKGHNPKVFADKVQAKKAVFEREWKNSLQNQIHDLPDFSQVMRELRKHFRKLEQ